jgi:hypothetical protein
LITGSFEPFLLGESFAETVDQLLDLLSELGLLVGCKGSLLLKELQK